MALARARRLRGLLQQAAAAAAAPAPALLQLHRRLSSAAGPGNSSSTRQQQQLTSSAMIAKWSPSLFGAGSGSGGLTLSSGEQLRELLEDAITVYSSEGLVPDQVRAAGVLWTPL